MSKIVPKSPLLSEKTSNFHQYFSILLQLHTNSRFTTLLCGKGVDLTPYNKFVFSLVW